MPCLYLCTFPSFIVQIVPLASNLGCNPLTLLCCRSWFVLSARYKALHCAGAALCLASLALFVYANSGSSEASDVVLGDGLVIMGAMLYAACNVTQEKLLREPSCPRPNSKSA